MSLQVAPFRERERLYLTEQTKPTTWVAILLSSLTDKTYHRVNLKFYKRSLCRRTNIYSMEKVSNHMLTGQTRLSNSLTGNSKTQSVPCRAASPIAGQNLKWRLILVDTVERWLQGPPLLKRAEKAPHLMHLQAEHSLQIQFIASILLIGTRFHVIWY